MSTSLYQQIWRRAEAQMLRQLNAESTTAFRLTRAQVALREDILAYPEAEAEGKTLTANQERVRGHIQRAEEHIQPLVDALEGGDTEAVATAAPALIAALWGHVIALEMRVAAMEDTLTGPLTDRPRVGITPSQSGGSPTQGRA